MITEIRYELPIYSSSLEKDPIIENENMDIIIKLIGVDQENDIRKVLIKFNKVICNNHISSRFTPTIYDSYDRIVELVDSEWLNELRNTNEEGFNYWQPKHYVLYLDEVGLFQFIAQGFEVEEFE